jgi:translation initiation factor IF-3
LYRYMSARISANDLQTKADQAEKFLKEGHKVTMRIEFKGKDGVKQKQRPMAGAILYEAGLCELRIQFS